MKTPESTALTAPHQQLIAELPSDSAGLIETEEESHTPYELDVAQPLELKDFPNQPRRAGQPPPTTIPNVRHLLLKYRITVRYNIIGKKLIVTMPGHYGCSDNFDNVALTQIFSLAALNGMNIGLIPAMVEAIADRNLFNPVADWINSRPWDGRDRFEEFCETLQVREGFPKSLRNILIRRWLLSCVAAALKPAGFRSRGVLTLQGPQGIGKTAWTKALVSDPALSRQVVKLDHHMDAHNKDSLLSAVGHWIVELGELESSLKRDVARLKGFLTADQDKVRRPYAKVDSEYQRRTVFCATVNDGNFLVDSTGNTRFWTIPVVGINHQHGIDMQQLFAQIKEAYEAGEQWWLTADEEERLEHFNKDYRVVSAVRERLAERLELDPTVTSERTSMSVTQVLVKIGIEHPTNQQIKECSEFLRERVGEPTLSHGVKKYRISLREPPDDIDEI